MFQLSEIKHMVRVPPWLFGETLNNAVSNELNRKLANKVVLDVGLCIALFDLISLEDSYIFPGDGASHTHVTFRFVVFRPFLEEILEGTIKASNAEGIQVTFGFFEDVYIRKDSMMSNSRFDETEKTWVWDYQTEDATHQMYMDIGSRVRFKVIEEQFTDTTPSNPNGASSNLTVTGGEGPSSAAEKEDAKNVAPYLVFGTINDHGLGLISWWTNAESQVEEEEEREEEEEEEGEEARNGGMNNEDGEEHSS